MSDLMPWNRFEPDQPSTQEDLPYVPASRPPPGAEWGPPTVRNNVGTERLSTVLAEAVRDALREAGPQLKGQMTDYARDTLGAVVRGQQVDHAHPTVTIEDQAGRELVIADAKSRSWRTLVQGLIFDIFAAVIAAVAMLTGLDPLVKETWIAFGILLVKSVVSAVISYAMRLRVAPTITLPGEKMALMPLPVPVPEDL